MTVSKGEKIVVTILGVIALGLVLGVVTRGSGNAFGKITPAGYSMKIVEPGIVKVALRTFSSEDGINEPALLLLAETGARCEHVSPLVVSSYTIEGIFYVDIGAYALKPGDDNDCGKDFQLAEALVPVTKILDDARDKQDTKIILRNSTNNYRLSRDSYAVYLDPLETINAIPDSPKGNEDETIVVCLKKSPSQSAPVLCRE
jgi:hypothetical protein